MPVLRSEDLAAWSGGAWEPGAPATPLTGVSHDSRAVLPGQLFAAIRGERFDGHAFVPTAAAAGAAAAMVERAYARPPGLVCPLLRVADTTAALGAMAAGHRRSLAVEIVAITGSAGKTTVKELAAALLSERMPTACTRGNWNNHIGLPLSLLAMEAGHRIGVFEAGTSRPGEIAALARMLAPDCAVITTIAGGHLEFFGTVDAVAREKGAILDALPPGAPCVLWREDCFFDQLAARAPGPVVTVSLGAQGDYGAEDMAFTSDGGASFAVRERATGERAPLRMRLPGEHNVRNCLMAVAVARAHGVDWAAIARALETFSPVAMRWVDSRSGPFRIINDAYNANPCSMRAALGTFALLPHAGGGKWLVLGTMLELGAAAVREHVALGRELSAGPWRGVIAVGAGGRDIAAGAAEAGVGCPVYACESAADAASVLRAHVKPGDAVLLKASRGVRLEEALRPWLEDAAGEAGT